MPRPIRSPLGGLTALPWPIWLIVILCFLPELALTAADVGLIDWPRARTRAYDNFGFWAGLLGNWRPNYALQPNLMFLTYGFLHAGVTHFLINMLTLVSLGNPLARILGPRRFLALYGALIVGGALGFAAWPDLSLPMVGASGALFGLAGVRLAWSFGRRRRTGASLAPIWQGVAGILALNLLSWWAMDGHLAWQTHLGGFLTGWVLAHWVTPRGR